MEKPESALAAYLTAKDLTQKEFAESVGVTEGAVSQWVAGGNMNSGHLVKVHALTGIPIQDLIPQLSGSKSGGTTVRTRSQSRPRRVRGAANA
jgi:transcriptional regulator with XRE-family HTH domain